MNKTVKKICVTAVMLALATVLSEVVPHFEMPLGGSVTPLSMLPIVIIAIMYNTSWGLVSAFIYSAIQLLFGIAEGMLGWGLTPWYLVGCMVFDYILAYTVLGLSGVFKKKGIFGIAAGVAMTVVLRFVCHVISGGIFCASWSEWENVWAYSVCYNGAYMLPELVLTVVTTVIVFKLPQTKRLMNEA